MPLSMVAPVIVVGFIPQFRCLCERSEAIQSREHSWIASVAALLAMTATVYSPSAISAALPPAAAVLTVTVCSVANRAR
jgi:hypothetical protein